MKSAERTNVQQRILVAATEMFSKLGYNGVSTRDIARVAGVNETSIYRHYPRKRDLFVAAIDSELSKFHLKADLGLELGATTGSRAAMFGSLDTMTHSVLEHRALARLLLFSVLEFQEDLDSQYGRQLRERLQNANGYFHRRQKRDGTFDKWPVLALIATLAAIQDCPWLGEESFSADDLHKLVRSCAEVWRSEVIRES